VARGFPLLRLRTALPYLLFFPGLFPELFAGLAGDAPVFLSLEALEGWVDAGTFLSLEALRRLYRFTDPLAALVAVLPRLAALGPAPNMAPP
jgi:hypothetical protein